MAQGQEEDLQANLDREIGWRRKELIDLRRQTEATSLSVLQRAAIALSYAHYEGFVKQSLFALCRFLNKRKLQSNVVKSALLSIHYKAKIDETHRAKTPAYFVDAIESLRSPTNFRIKIELQRHLDDVGNLDHTNLVAALRCVGIDPEPIKNLQQFIDEALLGQRNLVAHGSHVELQQSEAIDTIDRVIALLQQIKTMIENTVTLKSYMISVAELSTVPEESA